MEKKDALDICALTKKKCIHRRCNLQSVIIDSTHLPLHPSSVAGQPPPAKQTTAALLLCPTDMSQRKSRIIWDQSLDKTFLDACNRSFGFLPSTVPYPNLLLFFLCFPILPLFHTQIELIGVLSCRFFYYTTEECSRSIAEFASIAPPQPTPPTPAPPQNTPMSLPPPLERSASPNFVQISLHPPNLTADALQTTCSVAFLCNPVRNRGDIKDVSIIRFCWINRVVKLHYIPSKYYVIQSKERQTWHSYKILLSPASDWCPASLHTNLIFLIWLVKFGFAKAHMALSGIRRELNAALKKS
ncbi:unnamed protein product [Lactuca virosa]|uniref:Uncharacterized protein n=1 Tax=Lactuca virosa TaxID=75947 RepID=A0AAU9P151_9ASTR|nr:unnamed protein product [Lactuca virosa]